MEQLFQPASSSSPSENVVFLQLYDEFVSRGNTAVLKCLLVNAQILSKSTDTPPNQWSSSSTSYQQDNKEFYNKDSQLEYNFEWRIKNVANSAGASSSSSSSSSSSTYEPIIRLKSGQWEGEFFLLFFLLFSFFIFTKQLQSYRLE